MEQTKAHTARSATPRDDFAELLNRPVFKHAHLTIRPEGRQLVIDRAAPKKVKDDEPRTEGEDDRPGQSGEGDEAREAETPTRDRITGFSEKSRRRLRKRVHAVQRDAYCLFTSLTFHKTRPTPDEAKRALRTFWKRLRRQYPQLGAVWKMEPQTKGVNRGVPHFHLLVYGVRFIDAQWLSRTWQECTEEQSEEHRKQGVDVEPVRSDSKVQGYLAKYFSKEYDEWPEEAGKAWGFPGRFWGMFDADNIPWAGWALPGQAGTVELRADHAAWLIRTLLDRWEVDTGGVLPPSLTVNTRGDPMKDAEEYLSMIPA